jgi:peroxiredoxin
MRVIKKIGMSISGMLMICIWSVNTKAQSKYNFTIHGSFKNMEPPAKVYLIYASFLNQPTDSAAVTGGKYEFTGFTESPTGADISLTAKPDLAHPQNRVSIILDKGELDIESSGLVSQIEVTGSGSKATDEFNGILDKNRAEIRKLNIAMQSDSFKNDAAFKKAVSSRFNYIIGSSLSNLISYARNNPQASISPYLTYLLMSSHYLTHAMSDTLVNNVPNFNQPTKLNRAIAAIRSTQTAQDSLASAKNKALDDLIPIGSTAPDFTQYDKNGKPVSLSSFKGKYILVDFWASWCAPCRAENPNVVKAYNTYKSKPFTIIGVSLDGKNTRAAWLAAIKNDGLTWTEISDLSGWSNAAAKLYGVHAIPQNFLIDPNGKIIGKNLRGDELNKKLASLFN